MPSPTRTKPRSAARRQEARAGWLFAGPWLVSLVLLTALPMLATAAMSLTNLGIVDWPDFTGLTNYDLILTEDPSFWTALHNTAVYTAVSVPLRLMLAFGLALLLHSGLRGVAVYQTLFYLPSLVPPVAATVVFMLLLTPGAGPVNVMLSWVGVPAPDWVRDPAWALWTLVLLSLWPLGVEALVFLAALREVPAEVQDAARLDTRRPWERMLYITLPLISPAILFNLVIGVINSFQVFAQAMVIGGTTGNPSESTLMYLVLIYRMAFRYFSLGYAAALSVILLAILGLVTWAIFRLSRRWVHYEGGQR
jgi:multiple sugar transport system permease protein